MNVITIPKTMARQDDLVIVPRRAYEALVSFQRERETLEADPDTGLELSERAKRRLKRARRGGGRRFSLSEVTRRYS